MTSTNPPAPEPTATPLRRRTATVGLAMLALLPCVMSMVAEARTSVPTPTEPAPAKKSLAFHQYGVNLGPVQPRPVIPGRFVFKNVSPQPLTITNLIPSCGCLNPEFVDDQQTFAPGETGAFHVRIQTASEEAGPKDYTVRVLYNDGQPQEETVRFKLTLPERVVVISPPGVAAYLLDGKPFTREVTVTDFAHRGFEVTSLECTTEFMTAEIDRTTEDEAGHPQTVIALSFSPTAPPERTQGHVKIHTNDPHYHTLYVPVVIQGPSEPAAVTQ